LIVEEIQQLFNEEFQSERDRALFGVCLYTGCRINNVLDMILLIIRLSVSQKKLE
jgi:hypothetical protein